MWCRLYRGTPIKIHDEVCSFSAIICQTSVELEIISHTVTKCRAAVLTVPTQLAVKRSIMSHRPSNSSRAITSIQNKAFS
jgi:hypothetical protein